MVKSMTGYGNHTLQLNDSVITVEIKTVNSRYLDIILKMPHILQEVELPLKKKLQAYFKRGRVELYITVTGEPIQNKNVTVNWPLLDEYMDRVEEIKNKYTVDEHVFLSAILHQESIFTVQEEKQNDSAFFDSLEDGTDKACLQVMDAREYEGNFLKRDLMERIEALHQHVAFISDNIEDVQALYRKRMRERILQQLGQTIEVDQHQLIQEVALLAEKGDIQEELTRLGSHLHHFQTIIQNDGEVGRKLDFIIQEMHRETNTIGSKSIDTAISETVVHMKSDIEKMKEQIQNIE